MRVICGKYKGRTLIAPKGDARPTLDRTKETLFNILMSEIGGARVLDLFAGSGQLAIECLSRGAESAILCDNNRHSVEAIRANFQKIGEPLQLMVCDWSACLSALDTPFDLVFVDPPYKSNFYLNVLEKLDSRNLVSEKGIVVCEHSAEDDLPQEAFGFAAYDRRKIGSVKFTFYKRLQ